MRVLKFKLRKDIPGMRQAKHNGYSVIHGAPFINGYEIMYPNGDVASGFTLEEATEIVFNKEEYSCVS